MPTLQETAERLRQSAGIGPRGERQGIRFVRWTDFEQDILDLWRRLPWPISGIAGCPRSGMYAAAKLAILSGVPLWAADEAGPPKPVGHGQRLRMAKKAKPAGPLVVVEDSTFTGNNLRHAMKHCQPGTLSAVLYANPQAKIQPDIVGRWLPPPHFFEWHYFGSALASLTCFDLDGVLCDDCPPDVDDDGPRYAAWLAAVQPRSLPRTYQAGAVVTARLERWRPQTEEWLARHGVKFRELVMGPWKSKADRAKASIGRWKASQYERFPGFTMFVESNPRQAAEIHAAARQRRVACNQTGEVWG